MSALLPPCSCRLARPLAASRTLSAPASTSALSTDSRFYSSSASQQPSTFAPVALRRPTARPCPPLAGPSASAARPLSTSAVQQSGGKATKKLRKVMLQPKRYAPLRMSPKITALGEKKSRYGHGKALSANRDPTIFRPTMNVDHIPVFEPSAFQVGTAAALPGKVMRFSPNVDAVYKAYGQHRRLSKERPFTASMTTVVTRDTLALIARLKEASSEKGSNALLSLCLTGEAYSGKSVLLDQAVAYACESGWIVLYMPSPRPLVTGWEPYEYNEQKGYYLQEAWSLAFMRSILSVNKTRLPSALAAQLDAAIKASSGHAAALEDIVDALVAQNEVPVFVGVDNAQILFKPTSYPDVATMTGLDSFALSGPRLLLDLATGARPIARGGAILAQSFEQPTLQSHTLDTVLGLRERDPYEDLREGHIAYGLLAEKLERYQVGRLDRQEAVGIFELLRDTARLHAAPSDRLFLQHYISADGLAGQFKRNLTESLSTA